MGNKEKFYSLTEKFFTKRIVKEIYSTEHFCVLNFSNLFYIGCPYDVKDHNLYGMVLTKNSIVKMINDESLFFEYIKSLSQKDFEDVAIDLSENNFQNIVNYVEQKSHLAPTKHIDFDLEERILNINKGKKI